MTSPPPFYRGRITVDDLRAAQVFEGCELVETNTRAMQQPLTGVNITAPPFTEFARRGEIVMCPADDIRGTEPASVHGELAEIGAAALVISTEDAELKHLWLQQWPQPALIPLVVYPWHRRFADLARAVDDAVALAHEQDGLFVTMVHEGRGIQDLLDALERTICAPVLLLDHTGHPVGRGRTPYGYDDGTYNLLVNSSGTDAVLPPATTPTAYPAGRGALPAGALIGIATRQDPYAYLHASLNSALTRTIRQRLIDAAAAIAIESLRHRSGRQNERVLAEAALWNLIQSSASSTADDDFRRLIAWGLGATQQHYVVAGAAARSAGTRGAQEAISKVRRLCLTRYSTSVVASGGDSVVVVLPVEVRRDDDIITISKDVIAWGVAEHAVDVRALPVTARTALRTARAALLREGAGAFSAPGDVRPWLMIVDIADNEEARKQADRMVAALHSAAGDLVRTLQVLVDENCNVSATARRLYLNRHSLLYRIERIEHLTGTDINSPFDRLMLQLCLIIHDAHRSPE